MKMPTEQGREGIAKARQGGQEGGELALLHSRDEPPPANLWSLNLGESFKQINEQI